MIIVFFFSLGGTFMGAVKGQSLKGVIILWEVVLYLFGPLNLEEAESAIAELGPIGVVHLSE